MTEKHFLTFFQWYNAIQILLVVFASEISASTPINDGGEWRFMCDAHSNYMNKSTATRISRNMPMQTSLSPVFSTN